MSSIYALIVGINTYRNSVPPLRGCVNDARAMEALLKARTGNASNRDLSIRTLLNEQATRVNVIAGFRDHLSRAKAGDVAFFFYAGHGSQEPAPPEFWHLEPDRLDETLVCYDSRNPGHWDLADKELGQLISEVAARGCHVVIVLDCCHSGSGTRNTDLAQTAVRRAPTDLRERPITSFIFGPQDVGAVVAGRDLSVRPSGWNVARGRHVLLAACRDDEEAKEYTTDKGQRGALSYFLGQTLETVGGAITYRDLFARAAALVRVQVQRQSPQLEATNPDDLDQPFLGGKLQPRPPSFTATVDHGQWWIDCGSVHGLPAILDPNDKLELTLFSFGAPAEDLTNPDKAVGNATVREVQPAKSRIEVTKIAAGDALFKAVVARLPIRKVIVRFEGDSAGVDLVRHALAVAAPNGNAPSFFIRENEGNESPDYRLLAQNSEYVIVKSDDDRPMIAEITNFTRESAQQAIQRLEHIARWKLTAELRNPCSSISSNEIRLEVLADGKPLDGMQNGICLAYTQDNNGNWVEPKFMVRIKNSGKRRLYVSLLDLPQTFGIFPILKSVACQKLDPGEETFADNGLDDTGLLTASIPDEFWKQGVCEIRDLLKLIVCTSEFDGRRLMQDDLDLPRAQEEHRTFRTMGTRGFDQIGTLDRLMERVQQGVRHIGGAGTSIDDWQTLELAFTTSRPLAARSLVVGRPTELIAGVRIEPHPSLRAKTIRIDSMSAATRSVGSLARLPALLYEDAHVVRPFEFVPPTRSAGDVLNVIELNGVENADTVSRAHPLKILVPGQLAPHEHVLPVAFDGEFYFPVGRAVRVGSRGDAGAQTEIFIEWLPAPTETQVRSLGGAFKIFFYKVFSRVFGTNYPYPILAAATVDGQFNFDFERDPDKVRARVAAASKIALFVHGIIGETLGMASALTRAGVAENYDLVLTFDYESLNDPIETTARSLKQRLHDAGLTAGHGKRLDVFAHSMGGLVTRWFIECEGGNQIVNRLVMVGTPNNGSPWPTVEDWAMTALSIGMNRLSHVFWPAGVVGGLASALEHIDNALDEMRPDSNFLKQLHQSADPKIPYYLVAGDTSKILSTAASMERTSQLSRLLRKLWPEDAKYRLANHFFEGNDNDIAVSRQSMGHLPDGRQHALVTLPVACDHLSYFSHPAGLEAIKGVVTR